jgi:transcription antitermination factor NusG
MWLIVRVRSRSELLFRDEVKEDLKLECYVPLSRYRTKRTKRRKSQVEFRAAFSGYAFLRNEGVNREALRKVRGFLGVLGIEGEDVLVGQREIDRMKARQLKGDFDELTNNQSVRFHIGERVRVEGGPFEGQVGVVLSFLGRAKSSAEIELLSYKGRPVKIPLSFLK